MSKTLGQIAYEAHQEAAEFAAYWDAQEPAQKETWQAAAEAVEREVVSNVLFSEKYKRECAVIEAAKRWKAGYPSGKPARPMHWSPADALLWEAVRALDSEEG